MFHGRHRELHQLTEEFDRARASLVVIKGRRRVGKSRLLREALSGRTSVHFQATRVSAMLNLEAFKGEVSNSLGPNPILDGIQTWEGTLHYLANLAATEFPGLAVVIDEFPYVTDGDPSLPSTFQRFWDTDAKDAGNLKLILCGSALSQMSELLAERNPLYGRATKPMTIRPLPLRDAALFFPDYSDEDLVTMHGVFGGMPYYLQLCDPAVSLRDNIVALLLSDTGALLDEPMNLLQTELREPAFYSSILSAIASGCTTSNEIASRIGDGDTRSLGPYLQKLLSLDLITISKSLDASPKSRDLRIGLKDNLIAFWHRFVRPNLSAIGDGYGEHVFDASVSPAMSQYMGAAFERICIEHVRLHGPEFLGSPAETIGRIWGKDYDIDLAGKLYDGTFFYGECKWRNAPVDMGMVETQRARAEMTAFGRGQEPKRFPIFSRGGFKPEVERISQHDDYLHLVGLDSLVRAPNGDPRPLPTMKR